ncbi:hypothetical protein LSM04_007983 [Trypanosoma melophagium]|uniref:uncharacterized protein n=1 Tax=Trypanosoma melophagium TaxID=715481 RepID=UPI00351A90A7|nr:hypothetical protein LSM04_007983 [Trypanosoma melophagium]
MISHSKHDLPRMGQGADFPQGDVKDTGDAPPSRDSFGFWSQVEADVQCTVQTQEGVQGDGDKPPALHSFALPDDAATGVHGEPQRAAAFNSCRMAKYRT